MQKKKWIFLALLLVVPGLMFSVSCQKKLVDASPEPMAKAEPKAEPKQEPAPAPAAYKAPGVVMQEDIYFDFDKATLTPSAQDNLLRKAEWLRENSDVTVTIEGHCDARGTNEYNLALGDRRAESAK